MVLCPVREAVSVPSFAAPNPEAALNYLSVENISRSYGERTLFRDATFGIDRGQKMALIAKNGTGKTSLLRILAGIELPETGQVVFRSGIQVGYLEQDPDLNPEHSVQRAVFDPTNTVMQAVREYEEATEHAEDSARFQAAFDRMDALQAWDVEAQVKEVLGKLSITDLDQSVATLSGGQRKRVAMAKMLIDQPDILILDEPTNHLDIEMIEWLEGFLSAPERTILMVTHDRVFLDRVCDTIIELDGGVLHRHKGNYSDFLESKAHRSEVLEANVDKARNLYRKELDWMRRMPKARGTKAKYRQDAFFETEKVAKTNLKQDELTLEVNTTRMGSKVLELYRLRKGYGDKLLIDGFDYKFQRSGRVGIVGRNGTGKSTLLKLILGQLEPDSGKVVVGETVQFGYYGQDGLQGADDKRVIEVITDIAEHIPLKKGKTISAAQMLERFLFPRDQHYQYVYKLSGGERKRLYLLTVLMANPNFLILDEPTNDLDILTLNVLEDFLMEFEGCLLIVTHDRHFMNKLVDHLLVFEGDGKVSVFVGNYDAFVPHKKQQDADAKTALQAKKANAAIPQAARGKMGFNEKREFEQLGRDIELLGERKTAIEAELESLTDDHDRIMALSTEFERVKEELDTKELRWLELSELE
jgi:ATP-binding cassette subfamily F protein uup